MPTNAQPGENSVTIVKSLTTLLMYAGLRRKIVCTPTREEDTNACNIFLGECNSNKYSNIWKVDIIIEGNTNAVFKVDTGADVTVINHKTFSHISGKNCNQLPRN